ncbi:MAG: 5'/3'-nucleotidase SurE [Candidatus Omnitrophota bacterium]
MKKTILLTNDDGILSPGIQHLKEYLSERYTVVVVAPDRERSAISMSLTLNRPIRMHRVSDHEFAVDGTPADCINLALNEIMPRWPDFVVSGMNQGENLCEDVYFSGTVAGAFTARMYGIPAMAVSLIAAPNAKDKMNLSQGNGNRYDFSVGSYFTGYVLDKLLPIPDPNGIYNLNIPTYSGRDAQIMITHPGLKRYKPSVVKRLDPRDREYFWIGTGSPDTVGEKGTDLYAISNGHISLSILKHRLIDMDETKKLLALFSEK